MSQNHRRSAVDDAPPLTRLRELSLMHVFRSSASRRDGREAQRPQTPDGETDLTVRSRKQREGMSEDALRRNLALDIASLMNTIRLDVCSDLQGSPRVAKSVVNFGFQDMDTLWRSSRGPADIAAAIRTTLIANEPRLRADSIEVRVDDRGPGTDQRLHFEIVAEMFSSPTDIALQFFAEVDPAAGKITLDRMQGGA